MTIDALGEFPQEPSELAPIARCFDLWAEKHDMYSERLHHYARFPFGVTQNRMEKSATTLMETLENSLTTIMESQDSPREKAEIIAGLVGKDYDARKECAHQLFGIDKPLEGEEEREDFVDMIANLIDEYNTNTGSFVEHVMEGISESFNEDLNEIVDRAESTRKGRVVIASKIIGRHALHLAETASSVAGGLWIYENFLKG